MPTRPQHATDGPNPLQAFAAEMGNLRRAAGTPTFEKMAAESRGRVAKASMHAVVDGKHLPKWETVEVFLEVLGVDPGPWQVQWELVDDWQASRRNGDTAEPTDTGPVEAAGPVPPPTTDVPPAVPETRRSGLRYRTGWAVAATAVIAGTAGALLGIAVSGNAQVPAPPAAIRAVEIQNEIAVGPSGLIEDPAGPAYLSTRTQPYCARNGCKVDGTDMSTGALLVVVCHVTGAFMTNYNLDSDTVQHNSDRVKSSLWYRARFPDGRTGYLSEVYVAPQYRGGLELSICT